MQTLTAKQLTPLCRQRDCLPYPHLCLSACDSRGDVLAGKPGAFSAVQTLGCFDLMHVSVLSAGRQIVTRAISTSFS